MKNADIEKYTISPEKTRTLDVTEIGSAHDGKIK
jgi:predicted RNA-binding protein with TRAM domain